MLSNYDSNCIDSFPVLHFLHTMKVFIPVYSVTLHVTVIPVHIHKQLARNSCLFFDAQYARRSFCANCRPKMKKYVFTPYIEATHLDLHSALRVCTHIALENKPGIQMKVVEVHNQGMTPVSPVLVPIFGDLPLLKASGMPSITLF